jgi:hypothetical protein
MRRYALRILGEAAARVVVPVGAEAAGHDDKRRALLERPTQCGDHLGFDAVDHLDGAHAVAEVVDAVGDEGGVTVHNRALQDLAADDQDDDALVQRKASRTGCGWPPSPVAQNKSIRAASSVAAPPLDRKNGGFTFAHKSPELAHD